MHNPEDRDRARDQNSRDWSGDRVILWSSGCYDVRDIHTGCPPLYWAPTLNL